MTTPRALAEEMERNPLVPKGPGERFAGYGVMGLPFSSGHVLSFSRTPASSLGPAHTAVWHRTPAGNWTCITDTDPSRSCPRFFGEGLDDTLVREIELSWEGPFDLSLRVRDVRFEWGIRLGRDLRTRGVSLLSRVLPGPLRRSRKGMYALGRAGGRLLGLGKVNLAGAAPNGQRFRAAPRRLWRVEASAALLASEDLGSIGSLEEQASLGDVWIPSSGIFSFGEAWFDDFDPERHSTALFRPATLLGGC